MLPWGASLRAPMVKRLPAVRETWVRSPFGKIPWRWKWQPTPVLLPGIFHGWRSLVGYSPWDCKESNTTEQFHWLTFIISVLPLKKWILGYYVTGSLLADHKAFALNHMSRVRKAAWAVSPGKTAAEPWDRIWLGKEEFRGRCLMCGNRGGADWAHMLVCTQTIVLN